MIWYRVINYAIIVTWSWISNEALKGEVWYLIYNPLGPFHCSGLFIELSVLSRLFVFSLFVCPLFQTHFFKIQVVLLKISLFLTAIFGFHRYRWFLLFSVRTFWSLCRKKYIAYRWSYKSQFYPLERKR